MSTIPDDLVRKILADSGDAEWAEELRKAVGEQLEPTSVGLYADRNMTTVAWAHPREGEWYCTEGADHPMTWKEAQADGATSVPLVPVDPENEDVVRSLADALWVQATSPADLPLPSDWQAEYEDRARSALRALVDHHRGQK